MAEDGGDVEASGTLHIHEEAGTRSNRPQGLQGVREGVRVSTSFGRNLPCLLQTAEVVYYLWLSSRCVPRFSDPAILLPTTPGSITYALGSNPKLSEIFLSANVRCVCRGQGWSPHLRNRNTAEEIARCALPTGTRAYWICHKKCWLTI